MARKSIRSPRWGRFLGSRASVCSCAPSMPKRSQSFVNRRALENSRSSPRAERFFPGQTRFERDIGKPSGGSCAAAHVLRIRKLPALSRAQVGGAVDAAALAALWAIARGGNEAHPRGIARLRLLDRGQPYHS